MGKGTTRRALGGCGQDGASALRDGVWAERHPLGGSGIGGNDLTAMPRQLSRATSHSSPQGGHCVLVISINVAHEDLLCARTCPRCLAPALMELVGREEKQPMMAINREFHYAEIQELRKHIEDI